MAAAANENDKVKKYVDFVHINNQQHINRYYKRSWYNHAEYNQLEYSHNYSMI